MAIDAHDTATFDEPIDPNTKAAAANTIYVGMLRAASVVHHLIHGGEELTEADVTTIGNVVEWAAAANLDPDDAIEVGRVGVHILAYHLSRSNFDIADAMYNNLKLIASRKEPKAQGG